MSATVIYVIIFLFWFSLALGFLALDLIHGRTYFAVTILGRDLSPAWVFFGFAAYSGFRLFINWNYQQTKMRRRVADEILRNQRRVRQRSEEPPDPNFQFTDSPPPPPHEPR